MRSSVECVSLVVALITLGNIFSWTALKQRLGQPPDAPEVDSGFKDARAIDFQRRDQLDTLPTGVLVALA